MQYTLQGVRIIDRETDLSEAMLTVAGPQIKTVGVEHEAAEIIIEARGMIVTPGFIDVHTHGGGGFNLHTSNANEIKSYAKWVSQTGVTSFLIGIVGIPEGLPLKQIEAAVTAIEEATISEGLAQPLGIFLEGPYINVKRRGAHLPSWLRLPEPQETEFLLEITAGNLKLVTLAPELPGAIDLLKRLVKAGVTVSIGHTDADYAQTKEALQLGATHVTHCFNAMRPLHHRAPGPLEAVAQVPQVNGELIADGVHVHPAMMDLLIKILGPDRTIIITDALSAAGNAEGRFDFAGQPAEVICGAARLADGTITGSVLTMDLALHNLLEMTSVSIQEAIGMLTTNPARSIKMDQTKGMLKAGYDADLLLFDSKLNLQATICRGKLAFAKEEWQQRLKYLV